MELRDLVLLRELDERGSLTAVARALSVTPSAVSQRLRSLERTLGLALTEPVGRGVRLTAPGRLLAVGAVEVAAAVASVEARLAAFQGGIVGRVDVAALPSAGVVLLPALLSMLVGDVEVRVHDHDVAEVDYAALARDHDLVIGHRMARSPRPDWQHLRVVDLLREPLDIALPAAHPLASREVLTPADVAGEQWIGVPEGYPFDDLRLAIEDAARERFRIVQRMRDNRLVEALVEAGMGIGILPRLSTRPSAGVRLVPLRGVAAGRIISALARPEVAERAVVLHVLDALRACAAEIAPATRR
ncbi:LysR family transcriptional regulator [Agrococcus sp. TF02-05]|uniref:LysR family transcriptional regulator n=1 Tax=Agrococcus sp. TF02-05 TaxID=2815211 RepID=UPI001AA0D7F9|nr:LysR family transcriptional regulator [Agrococcus sp. TF02-05]MBO1770367.1 LysR family transcriptional regulator [Agrococcus sp. TF02-05]